MSEILESAEDEFADVIVVVTGGASGIGHGCVRRFARTAAAAVVSADLSPPEVEILESPNVLRRQLDVTDSAACDDLATELMVEFGRIDILVTAAGLNYASWARMHDLPIDRSGRPSLLDTSDDYWDLIMMVNLKGTLNCMRSFGRQMLSRSSGAIVTIDSISGALAVPNNGAYCVSKAAVWMLTKCAALEFARSGVRVNSVAPGYTATPMSADIQNDPSRLARLLESVPAGRMGRVEDIADAVAFLASDHATYLTGCRLGADGGAGIAGR